MLCTSTIIFSSLVNYIGQYSRNEGTFCFKISKNIYIFKFARCDILYTMFMQNITRNPNLKESMQTGEKHKFLKMYKNSIYFKFMYGNYDTIYEEEILGCWDMFYW